MRALDAALVQLQRCITPEDLWEATRRVFRAVAPGRYDLVGLPSMGIVPMFFRTTMPTRDMRRFAEIAPLNRVIATRPGLGVARMSDFYTAAPGDAFFEEFLVPDKWRHAAALLFWDERDRFIGHVASLRDERQGDFTEEEMERLRALHPQFEAAVRRLLTLEQAAATQVTLEHALHTLPLALAVVDWDLALGFTNQAARTALHAWRHGAASGRALKRAGEASLPEDLAAAVAALREAYGEGVREQDFSGVERERVVRHAREPRMAATVRLVMPPGGRALRPSWILHFETAPPQDPQVARAMLAFTKLSEAEKTVAGLAAAGHDNRAIARRLGRSHSTVRTHLRNIFRKLGITSRARLAPLLQALEGGGRGAGA